MLPLGSLAGALRTYRDLLQRVGEARAQPLRHLSATIGVRRQLHLPHRDVLWDVSTPCAVVPPPGLYGMVGTGLLWGVSTLCAPLLDRWGVVSSIGTLLSLVEL
jgi:hypothetical protein